jgi:fructosamine-3-kinase
VTTDELACAAASLLGAPLREASVLHGGDLSHVLRITIADGRDAVVKGGPAPRTEAAMLRAMAASGAPVPRVLAVSDSVLVLEALAQHGTLTGAWGSLGNALSRLHGVHGDRYGWNTDYAFGSVTIENAWSDDWPDFWATRRLLAHAPYIPSALSHRIDALARDLANRLPRCPAPSLLHGDLWSGNVLVAGNEVSGLIDPACYYGHADADIAMLGLFDRPTPALFASYGALDPGSNAGLLIYRLWPALVHLRLFGAGYRSLVERLLTEIGV